jgi:hypothetical protein
MKFLALLVLIEVTFCAFGLSEVGDYVVRVEGPPPRSAFPQIVSAPPARQPTMATLAVLNGQSSPRTLIYEFHLAAGTYDNLKWVGNGLEFPPSIPVLDFRHRPVASLTAAPGTGVLATPEHPLVVPDASTLDLARWFAERMWIPLGLAGLFFAFNQRVRGWIEEGRWWPAARRRPVLLTALLMLGAWLALFIPGAARYDVGDDPAMEMLASGYVSGQPSPHLVFINVLYGFVLQALYSMAAGIPWYPVVMLVILLASLGGSAYLVLRSIDGAAPFAWLWLVGLGFGAYFVSHLQFTSVAYLAGFLGLLIFSMRTSRLALAAGAVLVFLGSLVRFDSFLLLLLTALPASWMYSRRALADKLIFVVGIVLLAAGGLAFDRVYSAHDPGWADYREYNRLRGDLHMNPKFNLGPQNLPAFAHVGWSENDAWMFSQWLYEDPAVFSTSNLAYLDQNLTSNRDDSFAVILLLSVIALSPAPVAIFAAVLMRRENELTLWMRLAVLVPVLLVLGYLSITTRLPARVAVPPLYAASLFLLARWSGPPAAPSRDWNSLGIPVVFITLTFFSIRNLIVAAGENREVAANLEADLRALEPVPGQVVVASINAMPLERLSPFTAVAEMRRLDIIQLMWSGGSPSFNQQLQRHGSTSLFQSVAHDPRFRFAVPTSNWDRAQVLARFWQEHGEPNLTLVPVTLPDGNTAVFTNFTLMQAVPAPPPAAPVP